MFLLFLLGHRLLDPISMKLKAGTSLDDMAPFFEAINMIINGKSHLAELIEKIDPSPMSAAILPQMKYIFQNITQLSFEDFWHNIIGENTYTYEDISIFAGNATVNGTGIYTKADLSLIYLIFDTYSDYFKAANLDVDKIKNAVGNIYINRSTTILDAFDQLGFDFRPLFHILDKILEVFKPGSNYSITQFLKEYFFQPPSLTDELIKNAKIIFYDWEISYEIVENLLLSIVKLISSFLQSVISFVENLLVHFFKQVSFIVDFRAKSLNDRIKNVIDGLINDPEKDPDVVKIILVLDQFNKNGFNFKTLISDENTKHVFSLIEKISNPNSPLIKTIVQESDISAPGNLINFASEVISILKNSNGKMSDIQNSISNIDGDDEDYAEIKIAMTFLYNTLIDPLPKLIAEDRIVSWLSNFMDRSGAEDILTTVLSLPSLIQASQANKVADLISMNKAELDTYIKMISKWTSSANIAEIASDLLPLFHLGTQANCQLAANTVQKALGKVLPIVSKLGSVSSFPFNIIFDPLSRFVDKYAKLFSQEKITLKELLSSVYQPLGILVDVVNGVTSQIKSDPTVGDIFTLIPTTFLNVEATLDKFMNLQNEGFSYENVTLPKIVECFVIGGTLKADGTFHDVVPLKWLVNAAKMISSTSPDELTTAAVFNAFSIDHDFFVREISWFENQIFGEQTSIANILKTYTSFDFTNSLTAFSNLAGKVPSELITTADVENVMNMFFEDFERVAAVEDETTKKKLSTGAIVGIVIACVVIVAVIVMVVVIVVKRKKDDLTDPTAKP